MYRLLSGGGAGIRLSRRIVGGGGPPSICLSTAVEGVGEKEEDVCDDDEEEEEEEEKRDVIEFRDEADAYRSSCRSSARKFFACEDDAARRYVPEHPRRSGGRLKSPFTVMIEEELTYNDAKTFVFWDMNSTPLPPGSDVCDLPWAIKNGLKWAGYFNNQVKLFGYGDQHKVASQVWNQLRQVGGCYNHYDGGGADEDASFNSIVKDMTISSRKCSSPANFLLISSNTGFANALNKLKQYEHNVLLARASTQHAYKLESIVFRVWNWEDLVEGGPPLLPQPWNAKYKTFFND